MKQEEEINNKSRRDFIKTTALAAVATTACGSLACSCTSNKTAVSEKVRLLSPDGEIVEIDSAYLNHHENMAVLSQHEQRVGIPGKQFVMVVDLAR